MSLKLKNSKFRISFFLLALISLFSFKSSSSNEWIIMKIGDKYTKEWKKVDSLEKKGLPKSALEIVEQIYSKAKKDDNQPQVIKALVFRIKFINSIDQDAFPDLILQIQSEISKAEFPANAMLKSMLAEMYSWYFEANKWRFFNRTESTAFDKTDIRTWDLQTLAKKSIALYAESLDEAEKLKKVKLDYFDVLIADGSSSRELRPSLFDFLTHRVLYFYNSQILSLGMPADEFAIVSPEAFAEAKDFLKTQWIEKEHSTSTVVMPILQDLLKYRLESDNIAALIDADLKRLQIVFSNSVIDNKDSLYLHALEQVYTNNNNSHSTLAMYRQAKHYAKLGGSYNANQKESFKFKDYKKKAIEIAERAVNKYPNSDGGELCSTLIKDIKTPIISYLVEKTIAINSDFSFKIDYKNLSSVYKIIYKIDFDKYLEILNTSHGEKQFKKFKKAGVEISKTTLVLHNENDYQNHSIEFINKGLEQGVYLIAISNNNRFSVDNSIIGWQVVSVSDISYVSRKPKAGDIQLYVVDRKTGQPVKNVKAIQWFRRYKNRIRSYELVRGEEFLTNSEGFLEIPNNGNAQLKSFYLDFNKGNDRFITSDNFYYQRIWERDFQNEKVNFFLDRKIYRPGQVVYFKGIITKETNKGFEIVKSKSREVELADANHQAIEKLNLTSNEFGSFNGSFIIPHNILTGIFTIRCANGNITFNVEEYKRPKFEVEFMPFAGNYKLNDDVEVKGFAKSFSGATLTGAKVKYTVSRAYSGYRNYYWIPQKEKEIAFGEVISNSKGEFEINFKALPSLRYPKNKNTKFIYALTADVVDLNGETQSVKKRITIGYVDLTLDIEVTDEINQTTILGSEYKIITNNLNGEHVDTKGRLCVYKLTEPDKLLRKRLWEKPDIMQYSEEEWQKQFPGNEYSDELNPRNQKRSRKMFCSIFNTGKEQVVSLKNIGSWKTGRYIIEITATDAFGNDVKIEKIITVINEESKKPPYPVIAYLKTLNEKVEVGEKAKFLVASSLKKVRVLYEIEHNDKIVAKDWITLKNEQKVIEIPVLEKYRGNFAVHFNIVHNNRIYKLDQTVIVPWTNKELKFEFATFRNKLLPGENEEWIITVSGTKGDKVSAELLTTLYDASLDEFAKNNWSLNTVKSYHTSLSFSSNNFIHASNQLIYNNRPHFNYPLNNYDRLNWFGLRYYGSGYGLMYLEDVQVASSGRRGGKFSMRGRGSESMDFASAADGIVPGMENDIASNTFKKPEEIDIRKNFSETAFFYPNIKTNDKGEFVISFTIPESLTKWNFKGLAHTQDLMYGVFDKEVITQKQLMLFPNAPRFFRENDKIEFPVKISNLSKEVLNGEVTIEFFDAISNIPLNSVLDIKQPSQKFEIGIGSNAIIIWELNVPEGVQAISYRVIAQAGNFSDGEENIVPVLTNRILVTEALPLWINGKGTKQFEFTNLKNSKSSSSLKHEKYVLEFTSNPAWYAVQALPYLMEYPNECAEQIFSRYYANTLASHVANSNPKIQRVFDAWRNYDSPESLLSNLEKNQELKQLLLEETPWVLAAQNEAQQKRRIALLFDMNKMSMEQKEEMYKLKKMQSSNGGWPWFAGMKESRNITQQIVSGLGHLVQLGVININENTEIRNMIYSALEYLDNEIRREYRYLKKSNTKMSKYVPGQLEIQYLYARSFFIDMPVNELNTSAFTYFKTQAEITWTKQSKYIKGMIGMAFYNFGNIFIPKEIIKSLKEYAIHSEEMGMYWKSKHTYYWYQAPIERQALFIELFSRVGGNDADVELMKTWLLKQKQTQAWKTTKATAEAVYALLLQGTNWLEDDAMVEIKIAGEKVDITKKDGVEIEAGTSYFKTSWNGNKIKPEMANIELTKTTDGIAWGAVYWQYFENLDKIKHAETPLKIEKQLFRSESTLSGEKLIEIKDGNQLHVGDKVVVRIEIRSDRFMEYVHLKDMRASGFEPMNVISRYKYQDGLGYYQNTRDASTNFFFSHIEPGTYVFEYSLRVSHKGKFSNGITTIQSMYAPEFTSHSEGINVRVE